MTYDLALDEPRQNDEVYDFGNVHVVVDHGSSIYLDEKMRIDYDEEMGAYKLKSPERIIPGYLFL